MNRIDLNCDLGEGAGQDAALMPLITSANIACGAHAGDTATMRATVALAQKLGVAIGAHPGFADREHFGRRELAIAPSEAAALVVHQIQALREIAVELGAALRHVKLHGALYNLAAREAAWADAIAQAIGTIGFEPVLYVPWGSALARAALSYGLRIAHEVFADRTYQPDGTLTPRSRSDALIEDADVAVAQVLRMVRAGVVRATDGTDVPILADTLCLHGDGRQAAGFARRLRQELAAAGVVVTAFGA
jgi:UPF0271 protein